MRDTEINSKCWVLLGDLWIAQIKTPAGISPRPTANQRFYVQSHENYCDRTCWGTWGLYDWKGFESNRYLALYNRPERIRRTDDQQQDFDGRNRRNTRAKRDLAEIRTVTDVSTKDTVYISFNTPYAVKTRPCNISRVKTRNNYLRFFSLAKASPIVRASSSFCAENRNNVSPISVLFACR